MLEVCSGEISECESKCDARKQNVKLLMKLMIQSIWMKMKMMKSQKMNDTCPPLI
jgi:hypothetical protein